MPSTWKDALAGETPAELAREIDIFETQIELRRQAKMGEKVFGETRLRRGVYGQRYDNGQRDDGTGPKPLAFPSGDVLKGTGTVWDAPGMQRIKIPFGGLTPDQMDALAALAEEYSDDIVHVTTRQDVQLHYVHIDDTPDLMRRLAAVGITTREACGNAVRNVTACPISGVCREESFDVTPYATAMADFLLGHPDCQDFGRKFKVSFSGCADNPCGLVTFHDLGLIARTRTVDGDEQRGFQVWVGGGLGAVPHKAKLFAEFEPASEVLPIAQAIARVFARLGQKRNRAKARVKFLVRKLGIDEFVRLVRQERAGLPHDEAWTAWIDEAPSFGETPKKGPAPLDLTSDDRAMAAWLASNVYAQRQPGYATVTVSLPLGDATSWQFRRLADIARHYVGDSVRTTVEQNIVLRWVAQADVPAVYAELCDIGLGEPGAGTIIDVTACPGTDTCKLGIASSRGLAGELRHRLADQMFELDEAVRGLRVKISGCFNSCGQHHVADVGFYGVSRTIGGYAVPHFQVVLGGQWARNGGEYGLAVGAVPSRRIPEALELITGRYVEDRDKGESFLSWVQRTGKPALKAMLIPLMPVPGHDEDRSFYSDWGDPREFTLGDMGVGECAGEVVSLLDFDLADAERLVFEAQVLKDAADADAADEKAYGAMVQAARALVKLTWRDVPSDADTVVREFRARLFDTGVFHDPFAGGKFGSYLFQRHDAPPDRTVTVESAHHLVEEAQLFIEAAHACHARILAAPAAEAVV